MRARTAVHAATQGGAKALGVEGRTGAIRPGHSADITRLDLHDITYQPLNSAARPVVSGEAGRGVRRVMVEPELLRDAWLTRIDEAALRAELARICPRFCADHEAAAERAHAAPPHLLAANARVAAAPPGLTRSICRCPARDPLTLLGEVRGQV